MRDPELVFKAQLAASALERAWQRWRVMHGLVADPMPAISSYVGYSLEEPWGQPRVVFGLSATDAEQLSALLNRHDCIGPVHATVAGQQGREGRQQGEPGQPADSRQPGEPRQHSEQRRQGELRPAEPRPQGREAAGQGRDGGHLGREAGPMGRDTGPLRRWIGPQGSESGPLGRRDAGPLSPETGRLGQEAGPPGRETRPRGRESGPHGRESGSPGRESGPPGRESGSLDPEGGSQGRGRGQPDRGLPLGPGRPLPVPPQAPYFIAEQSSADDGRSPWSAWRPASSSDELDGPVYRQVARAAEEAADAKDAAAGMQPADQESAGQAAAGQTPAGQGTAEQPVTAQASAETAIGQAAAGPASGESAVAETGTGAVIETGTSAVMEHESQDKSTSDPVATIAPAASVQAVAADALPGPPGQVAAPEQTPPRQSAAMHAAEDRVKAGPASGGAADEVAADSATAGPATAGPATAGPATAGPATAGPATAESGQIVSQPVESAGATGKSDRDSAEAKRPVESQSGEPAHGSPAAKSAPVIGATGGSGESVHAGPGSQDKPSQAEDARPAKGAAKRAKPQPGTQPVDNTQPDNSARRNNGDRDDSDDDNPGPGGGGGARPARSNTAARSRARAKSRAASSGARFVARETPTSEARAGTVGSGGPSGAEGGGKFAGPEADVQASDGPGVQAHDFNARAETHDASARAAEARAVEAGAAESEAAQTRAADPQAIDAWADEIVRRSHGAKVGTVSPHADAEAGDQRAARDDNEKGDDSAAGADVEAGDDSAAREDAEASHVPPGGLSAAQGDDPPGPLTLAASAARVEAEARIRAAMMQASSSATQHPHASYDADPVLSDRTQANPAQSGPRASLAHARQSETSFEPGYEDQPEIALAWGGPALKMQQTSESGISPLQPMSEAFDDADDDDDPAPAAEDRSGHSLSGYVRRGRITRGYSIPRLSRSKRPGAVPGL